MKVSEEALLKSGFSFKDLQKLKNNIDNYGGSLDSVTHDLANRFKASKWITIVALFILVLTLMLASRDTSITLSATLAIVLPFIWYLAPARLSYKSWRYRKMMASDELNR
jgi:amino acid permease